MNGVMIFGVVLAALGAVLLIVGTLLDGTHSGRIESADDTPSGLLGEIIKWLVEMLGPVFQQLVKKPGRGQSWRVLGAFFLLLGLLVLIIGGLLEILGGNDGSAGDDSTPSPSAT